MGSLMDQKQRVERQKRYLFIGVEAAGIIATAAISPFLGIPLIAAGIYFGYKWFEYRAKNGLRF
jgi:hypothetical protein